MIMRTHWLRFVVLLLVLSFLAGCAQVAQPQALNAAAPGKQVLFLVQDHSTDTYYMITHEFNVMKDMLEKASYKVVVATTSDQPVKGTSQVLTPTVQTREAQIIPDLKVADVHVGDYAGIMAPCMASSLPSMDAKSQSIVRETVTAGKRLAAPQSTAVRLSAAGVFKGKEFAIPEGREWAVPGGIYKGAGVVQDGKIITSGTCPWMARDLKSKDGR
jgi:putative intracellular protease/amidase